MSAMDKLQNTHRHRNSGKGLKMILISIRINPSGQLKNSQPCVLCIKHMLRLQKRGNFKITRIYWSDAHGGIRSASLFSLSNKIPKHYSREHMKRILNKIDDKENKEHT